MLLKPQYFSVNAYSVSCYLTLSVAITTLCHNAALALFDMLLENVEKFQSTHISLRVYIEVFFHDGLIASSCAVKLVARI